MMRIQLFYFDGCPHFEEAHTRIQDVISDLGLDVGIDLVKIEALADALEHRFFGSPTVQVDGVDVDPAVRDRKDYGIGCRLYGSSGTPSKELIEKALREGLAA